MNRIRYGFALAAVSALLGYGSGVSVGETQPESLAASTVAIEQFVAAERTRACREVKADEDARSAYLAQPRDNCLCSPIGNCKVWVLVREADGLKVLLTASRIQPVEPLPTSHRGRPDIEASAHDSATESAHWVYQFDGAKYRRSSCSIRRYSDPDDPDKVLDKPKTSPCGR